MIDLQQRSNVSALSLSQLLRPLFVLSDVLSDDVLLFGKRQYLTRYVVCMYTVLNLSNFSLTMILPTGID